MTSAVLMKLRGISTPTGWPSARNAGVPALLPEIG
jgi:hypothetical protein